MLFNSFEFLLVFLPVTYCLHRFLLKREQSASLAILTLASFSFYAWWDWRYVPLLLGSVAANYCFGRLISHGREHEDSWRAKVSLAAAVICNLLLLGYFKYFDFILSIVNSTPFNPNTYQIPLGISFFTFTQIAYLVDTYGGKANERDPLAYALFVTWFPHLIAGPILHHREMMTQFRGSGIRSSGSVEMAAGATVFIVGLAKKVLIADNIGSYVAPDNAASVFTRAAQGVEIGFFDGWGGALAYTLQLYFDFSGYSDMAIGLSLMFGIRLPLNFSSPYKARNVTEFWRRWHMTLSRFLRDYVYIPFGGNRVGPVRHLVNLFLTMVVGGIWHGAGFTFVVWGMLHGAYLVVHVLWCRLRSRMGGESTTNSVVARFMARLLTFVCVVVGWVFFRSESLDVALAVLAGMAGLNGFILPEADAVWLGAAAAELAAFGVGFDASLPALGPLFAWLIPFLALALFAPNTQEIMRSFPIALTTIERSVRVSRLALLFVWRLSGGWALVSSLLLLLSVFGLNRPAQFLYFQF